MNNLSLVIYFAEVIGGLGGFVALLIFLGAFASVIAGVGFFVSYDEDYEKKLNQNTKKVLKVSIPTTLLLALILIFLPSKNTIMMIAASEYGEMALKSNDVQEIVNPAKKILKNWIEQQLAESEKKK